jgi:hypothetical protein
MIIRAVPHAVQAQTFDGTITVALIPAASSGLRRLEQRTGQSQADLTNCAISWYVCLDEQLQAGYHLTLWNDETGKAYSLSAGSPAVAQDARWLPGLGGARGAGSGARAAPSFYVNPSRPSAVHASCRLRRGLPPSPLPRATARPWLTVSTSRGSPAAAALRGGAAQPLCRPDAGVPARKPAAASRIGAPS